MARLNHPHIVRIYRLGTADEQPHFVMEYLEGAPSPTRRASLNWQQKAEMMLKVALAVHFLHAQGIVHRDLKPGNILVGADLEPKLLDFGLALDLGRPRAPLQVGEIAGTPEYLSPEQAAGVAGPGRAQRRLLARRRALRSAHRRAAFRRRDGRRTARKDPHRRPAAAAPPQPGDSPRPAEYLPEGARKGRRRALRHRPRDGRRPAPLPRRRSRPRASPPPTPD